MNDDAMTQSSEHRPAGMSDYYGIDGQPITQDEWLSTHDNRRVALDELDEGRVSTIHLGLDHSWGDGPPLIFETMIFDGEHDAEQWRYATLAEAKSGHARAVALVKGATA